MGRPTAIAARPRPKRLRRDAPVVAGPRPAGPRPAGYVLLAGIVGVLCIVGLVMVLSASSVWSMEQYGSAWAVFLRQLLWVGVGALAMFVASRIDYRWWERAAVPLLGVSVAMLLLVLVPGVGVHVNGSSRWLGVGQWRIQPSEIAKLAVLLYVAGLLARRHGEEGDPSRSTRPVLAVVLPVLLLVMLQPDMGTTLSIGAIVFGVLFVAEIPLLTIGKLLGWAAAGSLVLGWIEPYRRDRMLAFLHPWDDPMGIGYQTIQGRIALAEGGLTGLGLGASRAKWGFLPNAHTDFIFAIIGDEVGLLGTLSVLALFVAFAVLGVRTALRAPDRFGALLAAGITAWVVAQAFINIGAVVGVLPITGVPLPYVSFGGSSLVLIMGATGILLNIARRAR